MGRIRKEPGHLFLCHAQAIIRHLQVQILSLFPGAYKDFPVAIHKLHAMVDGIFHQRLKHQFQAGKFQYLILRLYGITEPVFKPHMLDHKIVSHMFQFIFHCNNALSAA